MSLDPYRDWLGLSSVRRPPTYYELLGVGPYEDDPDTLHQAALAQIAKLRKYQTGQHSDLTQSLMNEISQARLCLLDRDKKADYDLQLRLAEQDDSQQHVAAGPPAWQKILVVSLTTMVLLVLIAGALLILSHRERIATRVTNTLQPPSPEPKLLPTEPIPAKTATPEPVSPATIESPAPPKPVVPPSPHALPRLPGLQVLWEAKRAGGGPAPGWCWYLPRTQRQAPETDEQRWEIDLEPDGQESLFLPMPKGDCRLAMHVVRLVANDHRQKVYWGAFESPEKFAAVCLSGAANGPTASLTLSGAGNLPPVAPSVGAGAFWIELRRIGPQWDVYQSTDGEQFTRLATGRLGLEPALCGLRLTNGAASHMSLSIDYCRIEGNDTSYAERVKSWPPQPPMPDIDRLAEQFVGDLEPLPAGFSRLSYSFLPDRQVELWGGTRAEAGVMLQPGHRVTHGPIHAIRRVQFQMRIVHKQSALELVFADGSVIRFDAAKSIVQAGAFQERFAFRARQLYLCQAELGGTTTIAIDGKKILEGPCWEHWGQMITRVVGDHGIDIQMFALDGRYDVLPVWMAALRGDPKALALYAKRPVGPPVAKTPGPTMPEPSPPKSGAEILRRDEEAVPQPLVLTPGKPVNLRFINSADDENYPYLEPDGLTLHYTHTTAARDQLEFARRASTEEHFREIGVLNGLPTNGSQRSPSLSPDRRTIVFASNHLDPDNFDLFRGFRPAPERSFEAIDLIPATQSLAAETRALLTVDGLELYFTRNDADGSHLYVTSRDPLSAPFGIPRRIAFQEEFRGASLTADGLTMYLDRVGDEGRSAVFRTTRSSREDLWAWPTQVPGLSDGSTGRLGDLSPFVTPDGQLLYFASDRPDGAGGLDLWVMQLGEAPAEQPLPPGTIEEWLVLGPIPREGHEDASEVFRLVEEPRLPKKPPKLGDKNHGLTWQRGQIKDLEAGIYLLAFQFSVRRSVEATLTVDSTPGGVYFWVNGDLVDLGLDEESPWSQTPLTGGSSEPFRLRGGGIRSYRLLGAVCVADSRSPLIVRLIDVDSSEPVEDLISKIR